MRGTRTTTFTTTRTTTPTTTPTTTRTTTLTRALTTTLGTALALAALTTLPGCMTIVRPGEVGVRDTLGAQSDRVSEPGFKLFFWPIWDITRVSVQLRNLKVRLPLPSKEGLTIQSEISILYSIESEKVPQILREIGGDFEQSFLLPVFRSATSDVAARFAAKDMHSGRRADIEEEIRKQMNVRIDGRGFRIQAVLLKSIRLPAGLSQSIEARLRAEQEAQQMEYVIAREKQEAARRLIEAAGIRRANEELTRGLTPEVLRYKAIEAIARLAASPNAKVIITPSSDPFGLPTLQGVQAVAPDAAEPARLPAKR